MASVKTVCCCKAFPSSITHDSEVCEFPLKVVTWKGDEYVPKKVLPEFLNLNYRAFKTMLLSLGIKSKRIEKLGKLCKKHGLYSCKGCYSFLCIEDVTALLSAQQEVWGNLYQDKHSGLRPSSWNQAVLQVKYKNPGDDYGLPIHIRENGTTFVTLDDAAKLAGMSAHGSKARIFWRHERVTLPNLSQELRLKKDQEFVEVSTALKAVSDRDDRLLYDETIEELRMLRIEVGAFPRTIFDVAPVPAICVITKTHLPRDMHYIAGSNQTGKIVAAYNIGTQELTAHLYLVVLDDYPDVVLTLGDRHVVKFPTGEPGLAELPFEERPTHEIINGDETHIVCVHQLPDPFEGYAFVHLAGSDRSNVENYGVLPSNKLTLIPQDEQLSEEDQAREEEQAREEGEEEPVREEGQVYEDDSSDTSIDEPVEQIQAERNEEDVVELDLTLLSDDFDVADKSTYEFLPEIEVESEENTYPDRKLFFSNMQRNAAYGLLLLQLFALIPAAIEDCHLYLDSAVKATTMTLYLILGAIDRRFHCISNKVQFPKSAWAHHIDFNDYAQSLDDSTTFASAFVDACGSWGSIRDGCNQLLPRMRDQSVFGITWSISRVGAMPRAEVKSEIEALFAAHGFESFRVCVDTTPRIQSRMYLLMYKIARGNPRKKENHRWISKPPLWEGRDLVSERHQYVDAFFSHPMIEEKLSMTFVENFVSKLGDELDLDLYISRSSTDAITQRLEDCENRLELLQSQSAEESIPVEAISGLEAKYSLIEQNTCHLASCLVDVDQRLESLAANIDSDDQDTALWQKKIETLFREQQRLKKIVLKNRQARKQIEAIASKSKQRPKRVIEEPPAEKRAEKRAKITIHYEGPPDEFPQWLIAAPASTGP